MRSVPRLLYLLLPAATLSLLTGCTQLDLKKPIQWPFASEDKPGVPSRVATVWTDAVHYHPDRPADRGFGGRLFFYGREGDAPIKIDGSLVVYAFNETGRSPSDAKPDRKYVFSRENLDKHYSMSDIGHSYSFWIRWDEVGGEQTKISLIARFLPADGAPVIGEQTKHLLPGTLPQYAGQPGERPQQIHGSPPGNTQVRQVAYEVPTNAAQVGPPADGVPPQRMSSTTITIPPRFGRQRPVASVAPRTARQTPTLPNPAPRGQPAASAAAPAAPPQARPGPAVPARQGPPPLQSRFAPAQSRLPGAPIARPRREHSSWQRHPATSPSAPGSQPPPATPPAP